MRQYNTTALALEGTHTDRRIAKGDENQNRVIISGRAEWDDKGGLFFFSTCGLFELLALRLRTVYFLGHCFTLLEHT